MTVVSRTDHQAFGEGISAGVGLRNVNQGYGNDASTRQSYGLTEKDDSSGQQHTWFRKLETQAGRWSSADPYKESTSLGDPQSFNRYSYVRNQPTNYIDPSGLLQISFWECNEWGCALITAFGLGTWEGHTPREREIGQPPEPPYTTETERPCGEHDADIIYGHIRLEQKISKRALEVDGIDMSEIAAGACVAGLVVAAASRGRSAGSALKACGIELGATIVARIVIYAGRRLATSAYHSMRKRRRLLELCDARASEEEINALVNEELDDPWYTN